MKPVPPVGFLERMATASRARVRAARREQAEARLLARAQAAPAPPPLRLAGFDLIAELKLRSPAEGTLGAGGFDRQRQLEAYAAAGVACVSVLTEPDEFRGSLAHLAEAAAALAPHGLPVMRKDFLIDPYQVLEARAAGAGGVLVIVTLLDDAEVRDLLAAARECGLFVLLEAFDAEDLARIASLGLDAAAAEPAPRRTPPENLNHQPARPDAGAAEPVPRATTAAERAVSPAPHAEPPLVLAGVNCRNLTTLRVDFERFAALAPHLPPGLPAVAESGIGNAADARTVAALGYTIALVGSSLMQAANPETAAAELIAAGRGETCGGTHAGSRAGTGGSAADDGTEAAGGAPPGRKAGTKI